MTIWAIPSAGAERYRDEKKHKPAKLYAFEARTRISKEEVEKHFFRAQVLKDVALGRGVSAERYP
ncbi:hypothetical protein WME76_15025 [Sorangium sp. So ce119]|uniref:hypothetical protein n=1 Tax=Sorangium sp. So ce119 TaxID=3133279 RepID=UPI003F6158D7